MPHLSLTSPSSDGKFQLTEECRSQRETVLPPGVLDVRTDGHKYTTLRLTTRLRLGVQKQSRHGSVTRNPDQTVSFISFYSPLSSFRSIDLVLLLQQIWEQTWNACIQPKEAS